MSVPAPLARRRPSWPRLALLAALVIALGAAAAFARTQVPDVAALVALLERLGAVHPLAWVGIYTGLTMALIPVGLLVMSSGLILGYLGIPVVLTATVVGSTAAFALSRGLMREAVSGWIERRPRMVAIERAVARDAFRLTLFLRMSPVMPFGFFNYAAGALPITTGRFSLATAIGMTPRVILGVVVGSGGRAVLEAGSLKALGWESILAYGFAIVATVAVTVLMARMASAAIKASVAPPSEAIAAAQSGAPAEGSG